MRYTRATYERPVVPECAADYARWILNIDGSHPDFWSTPAANMWWRGNQILKTPNDLWVYQELFWRLRPTLVVETGTYRGGTALYYADLMDLFGIDGRVITVDNEHRDGLPVHPRLQYLVADSVADESQRAIKAAAAQSPGPVMVIHDSAHIYSQVRLELDAYAAIITEGSYFVVEDTMAYFGRWTDETWEQSPGRAVVEFLNQHPEFDIDWSMEKYAATTIHAGWLKRIS